MRLQYWDGSSYVFDDDIDMSETAVNASYTMSLYPGSLDQGLVKAVLTVGDESIEAEALAGTGTLTVLSTVNKDGNTTEIGGDAGAVNGGSVTAVGDAAYYVNDTEVPITDPERVKLLVDEVSNSGEYVEAMAGDAMDTVMSEYGLDGAGCETFYLDLVDTENGNAKVTMGAGDSLKIYWPIPSRPAAAAASMSCTTTDLIAPRRTPARSSAPSPGMCSRPISSWSAACVMRSLRSPASPPSRWSGRRAWTPVPIHRPSRPRSPSTRRTG